MEKTTTITFFLIFVYIIFIFFYVLLAIPLVIFFYFLLVTQLEIEKRLLYKISLIPLPFAIITMIMFIDAMMYGYIPVHSYNGFHPAIGVYIVLSASIYFILFGFMLAIFRKQILQHIKEMYSLTDEGTKVFTEHLHSKKRKKEIIEKYKVR